MSGRVTRVTAGIEASLGHGISYWEGTIVAAASASGAEILHIENLNHVWRSA